MSAPSASPEELFQYEALPDDSEFIRLFELANGDADETDTISCLLTIWPATEAPPYDAVSYTWGDVTVNESIRLNGRRKAVSRNCADVLRQLKYFNTSRYYWIDAICIDQDNVAEKSRQVANMGYVFERADHVLACLGMCNEDTAYAMQVMMKKAQRLMDHPSPDDKFIAESETKALRFLLALIQIAQNDYFRRVWILQELLLARGVSFCLGRHIVPRHLLTCHLHEFENDLIQDRHKKMLYQHRREFAAIVTWRDDLPASNDVSLDGTVYPTTLISLSQHCKLEIDRIFVFGRNMLSTDSVVSLCSTRLCQDPRDTVYGTLALTAWKDNKRPIVPDYTKTRYQLALECLKYYRFDELESDRALLRNLKLHADHPEVKSNIELRRQAEHNQGLRTAPTFDEIDTRDMPVRYFHGVQVSAAEWYDFMPYDVTLPNDARPGNWILLRFQDLAKLHDSLIVRQVGSIFAIVGRTLMGSLWSHRQDTADFFVYWNPEDHLTFLLTPPSNNNVCKEPFSSFAILQSSAGKEHAISDEEGYPRSPK